MTKTERRYCAKTSERVMMMHFIMDQSTKTIINPIEVWIMLNSDIFLVQPSSKVGTQSAYDSGTGICMTYKQCLP